MSENKIKKYYNQESKGYIKMYNKDYKKYPMNMIRLKLLIKNFREKNLGTVLDIGCGSCGPMIKMLKKGFCVEGFDNSEGMVNEGKVELKKNGYSPDLVLVGDVESKKQCFNKKYDAVIALGVFPHLHHEKRVLEKMGNALTKKGRVFVEFRNDLFALSTFNKYSKSLFEKLIGLSVLPKNIQLFYDKRFVKQRNKKKKKLVYSNIYSKFHNPLSIHKLFESCGLDIQNIYFYHYHAFAPELEKKYPKLFRQKSLELEKCMDWKGYFLASAFIVEAKK